MKLLINRKVVIAFLSFFLIGFILVLLFNKSNSKNNGFPEADVQNPHDIKSITVTVNSFAGRPSGIAHKLFILHEVPKMVITEQSIIITDLTDGQKYLINENNRLINSLLGSISVDKLRQLHKNTFVKEQEWQKNMLTINIVTEQDAYTVYYDEQLLADSISSDDPTTTIQTILNTYSNVLNSPDTKPYYVDTITIYPFLLNNTDLFDYKRIKVPLNGDEEPLIIADQAYGIQKQLGRHLYYEDSEGNQYMLLYSPF